jgi:hypothetical protein
MRELARDAVHRGRDAHDGVSYQPSAMIDRDHIGEHCQITWERWLHIRNDTETETAADVIASMLNTCARMDAKAPGPCGTGYATGRT